MVTHADVGSTREMFILSYMTVVALGTCLRLGPHHHPPIRAHTSLAQLYHDQHEEDHKKHRLHKVLAFSATSMLAMVALSAAVGAAIARATSRGK